MKPTAREVFMWALLIITFASSTALVIYFIGWLWFAAILAGSGALLLAAIVFGVMVMVVKESEEKIASLGRRVDLLEVVKEKTEDE